MRNFVITESEKLDILTKHASLFEIKMDTVDDLEKEIEKLEMKLKELKAKRDKKKTKKS